MPRLTQPQYLIQRTYLREVWEFSGGAYSLLSVTDQWAIHNFYMPTIELTDKELHEHRISATKTDPSLPHRAGRAYAKLKRGEWDKIDYVVTPSGRAISIRVIAWPQPDVKLLAKVFLDIAKREVGL